MSLASKIMAPCHSHLMSVALSRGLLYDEAKTAVDTVLAKAEKGRLVVDAGGSPRAWLVVSLMSHIRQMQKPSLWRRIKKAWQSLADLFHA